ncbi:MAG: LamG-like jellyroll fold domain-containing protein, partial [Candidatus Pacearchaeota archaeon]|nr:LamG-like jellyroll fold domain-containing protein [Candidatus Pacearchaeota archaeon]
VVGVRNNTNVSIYLDGVHKESNTAAIGSDVGAPDVLSVGASFTGSETPTSLFVGGIDEVLEFNRSLSSIEIKALYNASANEYYRNFTSLSSGDYIFRGYTSDVAGNTNNTEHRTVTIDSTNIPNNATSITLNSTDGTNRTAQNLHSSAVVSDPDGDVLNVTVFWFNETVLHLTQYLNESFANASKVNATLLSGNTTKGENWSVGYVVFDGTSNSSQINSSFSIHINNTPPTAGALVSPEIGALTTDRTPTFTWEEGSDDDLDSLTYDLNVSLIAVSTCFDNSIHIESMGPTTYELVDELQCLFDFGDYYNWSVRAFDGEEYSSWTSTRAVNISSEIIIFLPNSTAEFGEINFLGYNDTEDNSPPPLIIQNDGNVFVNVTINASSLWRTQANPNKYYTFNFDNVTESGENGSFNPEIFWIGKIGDYHNMPSNPTLFLNRLNYTNATDSAEIDINITVPPDEGSSIRNSTITFIASLG